MQVVETKGNVERNSAAHASPGHHVRAPPQRRVQVSPAHQLCTTTGISTCHSVITKHSREEGLLQMPHRQAVVGVSFAGNAMHAELCAAS